MVDFHIMGGGGRVNCSRQDSLSKFFLCYLATILLASNLQLAFLELVEERKNPRKYLRHTSIDLGSICK